MLQEEDFRSQKTKTLAEWIKGLRGGDQEEPWPVWTIQDPWFPEDHPSIHCLPWTGEGKREGEREINFYLNNMFIYWFNSHTKYCACTDVNKCKLIVKLLWHKQIGGQRPRFKANKQTKPWGFIILWYTKENAFLKRIRIYFGLEQPQNDQTGP